MTLTMAWDDAVAMQRGGLDPSVAFMQGRMKVAGSMGVMLALLPVTATPRATGTSAGGWPNVTEF